MSESPDPPEDRHGRRLRAAALSGLVFPGAGQVYLGARLRGVALGVATLGALALLVERLFAVVVSRLPEGPVVEVGEAWHLAWRIVEEARGEVDSPVLLVAGLWAVSVADAWLGSGRRRR